MQHARHIGDPKKSPYGYFHRIRMDISRPYISRPIVNQLLGQRESRAARPLYANRARQPGSEFVYPEWTTSAMDTPLAWLPVSTEIASYSNSLEQHPAGDTQASSITGSQDPTSPVLTSRNISSGSTVTDELVDPLSETRILPLNMENTSIDGATTLPQTSRDRTAVFAVTDGIVGSSPSTVDLSFNKEKPSIDGGPRAVATPARQVTTLIDWLEQVQARVPINLEEELNSPLPVRNDQSVKTDASVSVEKSSDPGDHSSQRLHLSSLAETAQRNTPLAAQVVKNGKAPVTITHDGTVSKSALKQAAVDIELPGSPQPPHAGILRAQSPLGPFTRHVLSQNDIDGKQAEPSKPVSEKPVVRISRPTKPKRPMERPVTIDALIDDQSSSGLMPTNNEAKPMARNSRPRAAKLNRIQQALEVQSRLMRGSTVTSNSRAEQVDNKTSSSQAVNHKPAVMQQPQTVVVQRTVSVPAMDYAYLERSYTCRLGPRGYK